MCSAPIVFRETVRVALAHRPGLPAVVPSSDAHASACYSGELPGSEAGQSVDANSAEYKSTWIRGLEALGDSRPGGVYRQPPGLRASFISSSIALKISVTDKPINHSRPNPFVFLYIANLRCTAYSTGPAPEKS